MQKKYQNMLKIKIKLQNVPKNATKNAKSLHYSLSQQNSVTFCKDFTRDRIFYTNIVGTLVCFYISARGTSKKQSSFNCKYSKKGFILFCNLHTLFALLIFILINIFRLLHNMVQVPLIGQETVKIVMHIF